MLLSLGNYYNLDFSLKGTYSSISEFISKIENDSELQFRIQNFKLVPGEKLVAGSEREDTKRLLANFSIKEINLNKDSLSNVSTTTKNNLINNNNNNNTNSTTNTATETNTVGNNTTNEVSNSAS